MAATDEGKTGQATEATPTTPPGEGQKAAPKSGEVSAEEAKDIFKGDEVTVDERGRVVGQNGPENAPREGATLGKRHSWY